MWLVFTGPDWFVLVALTLENVVQKICSHRNRVEQNNT